MVDVYEACENARYSYILDELLQELGIIKILRLVYDSDWQGSVDIDALLKDGRIFSYSYSYGSCSGCDDWEARDLSDDEIKHEMETEATFFSNLKVYAEWIGMRGLTADMSITEFLPDSMFKME